MTPPTSHTLTPHRRTVLDVVRASHDHPTARQVFDRVAKKDPGLSVATVYNSLNFLLAAGTIRRVGSEEEGVRYDGMLARHDHLICRRCGRIEDADVLGRLAAAKLPRLAHFQAEEVSVRVIGLCSECRRGERTLKQRTFTSQHKEIRP